MSFETVRQSNCALEKDEELGMYGFSIEDREIPMQPIEVTEPEPVEGMSKRCPNGRFHSWVLKRPPHGRDVKECQVCGAWSLLPEVKR
eukprot:g45167.t1